MNDGIITNGLIESEEPEYSSLSIRAKYLSILYFIISLSLLGTSFIPFFMKRVEGYDSHQVSGAMFGSIQLLYFVLINIAALLVFLLGNRMLKFSSEIKNIPQDEYSPSLKKAIIPLESFFILLGAFSLLAIAAVLIAILNIA